MIQGLEKLLETQNQPGLRELRRLLQRLLGPENREGCLVAEQILQPRSARVFRLRFIIEGKSRSVIAKRLKPEVAHRSELVEQRWLPAVGLTDNGPALLGSVAEPTGNCVWHVYDDLGPCELNVRQFDRDGVNAAIQLIAQIHARFAAHPLLGEVRLHGSDLGIHFYEANVRDATYALEACQSSPQRRDVRRCLLSRLAELRRDLPRRAQALLDWGGPETLLHGDLWAINIFVIPRKQEFHVRLIDWDHASVGPASYDLSTFLLRLPAEERNWALDHYRDEIAQAGWRLPSAPILNLLFETAEYARLANRVIWPAIALVRDGAAWAWDALTEVNQWFEDFRPVLACETELQDTKR